MSHQEFFTEYYEDDMPKYRAAVDKLKAEALEVVNPGEVYFVYENTKPGVLYPWDGGWETESVCELWCSDCRAFDWSTCKNRLRLRLLPKSPVTKGASDDYPIVDALRRGGEADTPSDETPYLDKLEALVNTAVVAAIGVPEQTQNYICLNCKEVFDYQPGTSCARCGYKSFHKTDAKPTKAAPVNDAGGGMEPNDRDWKWYLKGLGEGYGQAEFEGHKRPEGWGTKDFKKASLLQHHETTASDSSASPQAESDVLLSWLEEERNILLNSATLMWHDMETRGKAKHVAECITTTLDYIRESRKQPTNQQKP
jgi:DNA-directed RNA polymerase subunit RPC12/RpoP